MSNTGVLCDVTAVPAGVDLQLDPLMTTFRDLKTEPHISIYLFIYFHEL